MTTNTAHTRPKEPEKVRQALLDAAMKMAAEGNASSIRIGDIAAAAGVTKGGLLHHFPSKSDLVRCVMQALINRFSAQIDEHMLNDAMPGCFTRAYIAATLNASPADARVSQALLGMSLHISELNQVWNDWMAARLSKHIDTDSSANCEIARLAADGAWMAIVGNGPGSIKTKDLQKRLFLITRD